jgi:hypothetical protein
MSFEHILKFVCLLLLMALLTHIGPAGWLVNTVITIAGLWKLTA